MRTTIFLTVTTGVLEIAVGTAVEIISAVVGTIITLFFKKIISIMQIFEHYC